MANGTEEEDNLTDKTDEATHSGEDKYSIPDDEADYGYEKVD